MKLFILVISFMLICGVAWGESWRACPRCSYETCRDEILFCYRDGSKLSSAKTKYICPKCKKELTSVDIYCERCGTKQDR